MGRGWYRHVLEFSRRCRSTLSAGAVALMSGTSWDDGRLPWIVDWIWCWRWVLIRHRTTLEPRKEHPIESVVSQERAWGKNCRARPIRWPEMITVGHERPSSFPYRLLRSRKHCASAPVTPEAGEVAVSLLRLEIGWAFWWPNKLDAQAQLEDDRLSRR